MRNILAFLAAVLVIFVVAGYCLNWYKIIDLDQSGGTHRLQIDLNTHKIRQDFDRGKAKLQDTFQQLQEEAEKPQAEQSIKKPSL